MNKITYCIPCKNNLRYLKGCVESIKNNSVVDHEIIVYVDSNEDGTLEWLKVNQIPYLTNHLPTPQGIAYGYNRCIEASTTNVVMMFHADMVLGKMADGNMMKHLNKKTIVSATRVEPPLHPQGKEKLIKDFGMYPENFKQTEFNDYVSELVIKNKDVTTRGIFAPWLCHRNELTDIGGFAEELHSYYEDSDMFQRLLLNGCLFIQSWDSIVQHYTCRGGQFADGVEKPTTDQKFLQMRNRSAQLYMKKWGSWIKNDEYQHPILTPRYDIGFVVKDLVSPDLIGLLEMYGKVSKDGTASNDIVITFSEKDFMSNPRDNAYFINNINAIIADSVTPNNIMAYGPFHLISKKVTDISRDLIKI